jgi:hypothetical protein
LSYAFPYERPLPRGAFDLCEGPVLLGSTQVQQYRTRWACWVSSTGIRIGTWSPGQVMTDTLGIELDLFIDLGSDIMPGASSYSGGGSFTLSGLTVGLEYKWTKGANDTSITSGATTISSTGNITAEATAATLLGTPSAAVTAVVQLRARARPAKLSVCFEQDALPVVARQLDASNIEVRRKVTGVVQIYTFAGLSPVMFYNGVALNVTGDTDAVCLYIKGPGTKVFARFQRDNFGVEFEINPTLPSGITIRELRKTDRFNVEGSKRQILWGVSDDGKMLWLMSNVYPPPFIFIDDNLLADVTVGDGLYFLASLTSTAPTDETSQDVTLGDGVYFPILVTAPTVSDSASEDVTIGDGVYTLVVVAQSSPSDSASEDVTIGDGVYTLVAISSSAPTDETSIDVTLGDGAYSL